MGQQNVYDRIVPPRGRASIMYWILEMVCHLYFSMRAIRTGTLHSERARSMLPKNIGDFIE